MVQRVVARHADMAFEHVFFVFLRSWSQGFNVGDGITYVPGTGSDSCFDWKSLRKNKGRMDSRSMIYTEQLEDTQETHKYYLDE